ncbi:cyanophycin synthetase family protein [Mesorhizobium sp. CO1-1-8]|uniref:cyanophycin synthetase family protein n=1 Tax=Mesorhizobium sp. CO1-1-8 TaxID=2876631 RepID=UPI001CD15551|nr:hypothetical protein [Mesorhizobium sp. CO1-1-8]MBZ9775504.1 hypothetical protein [Mesorhizobium sp. CO1-1-8]
MFQIRIDLGALDAFPTDKVPGFADAIVRLLPGLAAHGCSYGVAGGFVRRMQEGTWLGHVVEHVALELQSMLGHRVTRGKTRSVNARCGWAPRCAHGGATVQTQRRSSVCFQRE